MLRFKKQESTTEVEKPTSSKRKLSESGDSDDQNLEDKLRKQDFERIREKVVKKPKSEELPAKVVEKFIEKQVEHPATGEPVSLAESPKTVVPELSSSYEKKSPVKSKFGVDY